MLWFMYPLSSVANLKTIVLNKFWFQEDIIFVGFY